MNIIGSEICTIMHRIPVKGNKNSDSPQRWEGACYVQETVRRPYRMQEKNNTRAQSREMGGGAVCYSIKGSCEGFTFF